MSTYFKGQRFDWHPTPTGGPVFEYALSLASDYLSNTHSNASRGVSKSKRKDKIEAICIQIVSALHGSLNAPGEKGDEYKCVAIPRDMHAYTTKQDSPEKVFGSHSYTVSIVDWLLSQNMLEEQLGNEFKGYSRYRASGQLKAYLEGLGLIWMPVKPIAREQLIIVRDKDPKTKNSFRVPLISNDKIEEELDQLETINTCLRRHCFTLNLSNENLRKIKFKKTENDEDEINHINFYQTQIVRIYAR